MNSLTLSAINWMHRTDIQELLEKHGYAVYENETTEDLREVLIEEINNGEILESEVI